MAANRPYWFEDGGSMIDCEGDAAVWTMFGVADDHFTSQNYPGQYGDEQRDFWLDERDCDGSHAYSDLGWGEAYECVTFSGCSSETRYCLYGPETQHQIPSYFSEASMAWFRAL